MNRGNPHPSPLPEGEGVIDSFEDEDSVVIPLSLWERVRVRASNREGFKPLSFQSINLNLVTP